MSGSRIVPADDHHSEDDTEEKAILPKQGDDESDDTYAERLVSLANQDLERWSTDFGTTSWNVRLQRARTLLQKAAHLGSLDALYGLGSCTDDTKEKVRLWKLASDKGHRKSTFQLAWPKSYNSYQWKDLKERRPYFIRAHKMLAVDNYQHNHQPEASKEKSIQKWRSVLGSKYTEIENAIRNGAIALLNHAWLVEFALFSGNTILPPRQRLPEEAFLTLDEIMDATFPMHKKWGAGVGRTGCRQGGIVLDGALFTESELPIIALSYMWLDKDHPDPQGRMLRMLAQRLFLAHGNGNSGLNNRQVGIFWDFGSLYQNIKGGPRRTLEEQRLFQQGLNSLASIYSHPKIKVFRVTDFPPPSSVTDSLLLRYWHPPPIPYVRRGWPFVESSWAVMADPEMIQDLRYPNEDNEFIKEEVNNDVCRCPLSPMQFQKQLCNCTFTNEKDDRQLVIRLYNEYFHGEFRSKKKWRLDYDEEFGDVEALRVADIILEGCVPELEELWLGEENNDTIGLRGFQAIAQALGTAATVSPNFRYLNLSRYQNLGEQGLQALGHTMHIIEQLDLVNCSVDVAGCHVLGQMLCNQSNTNPPSRLKYLDLSSNRQMGDEALRALAPGLHHVEKLFLRRCSIGVDGCHILAETLGQSNPPSQLKALYLGSNRNIGNDGIQALIPLLYQLELVDLSGCSIGIEGCRFLAETVAQSRNQPSQLRALYLGSNKNIDDKGLQVLAPILRRIEVVDMGFCSIGDAGCLFLKEFLSQYENHPPCQLKTLSLNSNKKIGDEGYYSLCHLLHHPQNFGQSIKLTVRGCDNISPDVQHEVHGNC